MVGSRLRGQWVSRKMRALTIIEIMIVIGIIALLSSLLLARYAHAQAVSDASSVGTQLQVIANSLESYRADHDAYPGTSGSGTIATSLFGGANNRYLTSDPSTPDGHSYSYYLFSPTHFSTCENGTRDGGDLAGFRAMSYSTGVMSIPSAGTQYYLCYQSSVGVYAQSP